jgi:hypothetical protein
MATKTFRLFQSINSASKIFQMLTRGKDELEQPVVLFLKGVEEALYVSALSVSLSVSLSL